MRIYLCPALMDWMVFLVLFAVLYGAGERDFSTRQCAWLGGVFQLTYLLASLLIGLALTRRNARAWLLVSTVASALLGIACLACEGYAPLLAALALFGVAAAGFFNAFQTFMRGEAPPGGLARSVGLYTLAWSLGAGAGVLSSGVVYRWGVGALVGLDALVGALILTVLLTHRPRPSDRPSADEHVEAGFARAGHPAYVWVAWLTIFFGMFVQRPLYNFFPVISARAGIEPWQTSVPLFLHLLFQGLMGVAMIAGRGALYRRAPLWLAHAAAALVFLGVWWRPTFAVCCTGIVLLGLYTGFAYFTSVFYASNAGRRSFNIGVNECLVGVGSFGGLFVADGAMKATGHDATLYLVGGLTALVAALVLPAVASLRRRG